MRQFFTSTGCVLMTLAIFALGSIVVPSTAAASWHDQSDQLPGMHKFPTGLAIVAGVAVVGCVVYMVHKHNKKIKATEEMIKEDGSAKDSASPESQDTTGTTEAKSSSDSDTQTLELREPVEQQHRLQFHFGVDPGLDAPRDQKLSFDMSKVQVKVGVSLGF